MNMLSPCTTSMKLTVNLPVPFSFVGEAGWMGSLLGCFDDDAAVSGDSCVCVDTCIY